MNRELKNDLRRTFGHVGGTPVDSMVRQISVIDIIRIASDAFERSTGKHPTSIYLGYSEWTALKRESWSLPCLDYQRLEPMADGKRIYIVTEDTHLAVA